ncbi:tripartite tricarboxylate transporter TctB family protein [Pacificibacter marinus]|uniref:tripartite tricarboxylate transporter TctB family protein n=1 Tax=Pacificibacter marinus TaxID=658057 RepID=UPI001C070D94|nr:tripartite tricarboxylate transporter TctB family protein [Pacificibacter marinus]MBU2867329.1 tripartite tricarboxylate transporter TctB family protein [Pacificibacter marinus]
MKHIYDKDVAAGLMFLVIGLFSLMLSVQFDFGSTARPGPGFFPTVLSVLLTIIGLGVAGISLRSPIVHYTQFVWRPFVFITLGVITFALIIGTFGLMPAVFAATLIASLAKPDFGILPRFVTALFLAAFSAFLFILCLGLPIALWSF